MKNLHSKITVLVKASSMLLLVILLGVGCSSLRYKREVSTLESSLQELKKTKMRLETINYDSVYRMDKRYWAVLKEVSFIPKDSIRKDDVLLLNSFAEVDKSIRQYLEQQLVLSKELNKSKADVEALIEKLKAKDIKADSVKIVVQSQTESALQIAGKVNIVVDKLNYQLTNFEALYVRVRQMVDNKKITKNK